MAKLKTLDTILSQLPDISLPEFDFLDSSFFCSQDQNGADPDSYRNLPSPQAVLEAAGTPPRGRGVWCFPELGVLVKFGRAWEVGLEEALTLRVINRILPADQVPTPEVFGWNSTCLPERQFPAPKDRVFGWNPTHKQQRQLNFIYRRLLPGQTLEAAWDTLSHGDKASVCHLLAAIVKCLRSVKQGPADRAIGSLNRGPVQDLYFSPPFHKGPFTSVRESHNFVPFISGPWMPMEERTSDPYRPMLPDTAPIFLSHGDLNCRNVLVVWGPGGNQLSVSGIVDWEQAGWYPDYWEYCKAMIVDPCGGGWMGDGWLDIVFHPSERDVEASDGFQFYWSARCP